MTKRVFLCCMIYIFVNPVMAETVYVTDLLKLNVTEAPKSQGKTLTTLSSGDPLVVLERLPGYAKIRTTNDIVGWTKAAYLVTEKPPRLIVAELKKRLTELENQTAQAKKNAQIAQSNAEKYQQMLQTTEQTAQQQSEELKKLQQKNQAYESSMDQYQTSIPMNIFLIACALLFLIGISLGWYIIDYRQRMRHGGFRI